MSWVGTLPFAFVFLAHSNIRPVSSRPAFN